MSKNILKHVDPHSCQNIILEILVAFSQAFQIEIFAKIGHFNLQIMNRVFNSQNDILTPCDVRVKTFSVNLEFSTGYRDLFRIKNFVPKCDFRTFCSKFSQFQWSKRVSNDTIQIDHSNLEKTNKKRSILNEIVSI